MDVRARKAMIDKEQELSITRQCRLLGVSRSTFYYQAVAASAAELALMRKIDEIHLKRPFYGSRRIRNDLEDQGLTVNRKKIRRVMRKMGIEALHPRQRTSRPGKGHRIYPYLLKDLVIDRPNQVWSTDITYIPMAKGFLYLVAILDWHSRKVLAWRLSNTLDTQFCIEALEEALERYGAPEIFNSDQGCQFTSQAFTGVLSTAGIRISMDGKGCWVDNVFVERLWRSLKYEEVYLRAYESVAEAEEKISDYFQFYNGERRHSSLGYRTPDRVYCNEIAIPEAA